MWITQIPHWVKVELTHLKTRLVNAIKIELMIKVRLPENPDPDFIDFLIHTFPFSYQANRKVNRKLAAVHLLEKMDVGTWKRALP